MGEKTSFLEKWVLDIVSLKLKIIYSAHDPVGPHEDKALKFYIIALY